MSADPSVIASSGLHKGGKPGAELGTSARRGRAVAGLLVSRTATPLIAGIAALIFWLPYALRAGFVYDDWATVAGHKFNVALFLSYRPGFVLWKGIAVRLFQTNPLGYYVSLAILFSAMVAMAVIALNELGVAPVASVAVGLLLIVSPYASSLALWWTASQMTLATLLGLAAIAVGARWIKGCPHPPIYLGASLLLLVAGIVTYEAVAPIVLLPGALIAFSPDRRRTLRWSLVAAVVGAAASAYMFQRALTPHHKTARPVAQYPARIWTIVSNGTSTLVHLVSGFIGLRDILGAGLFAAAVLAAWWFSEHRPWRADVPWQWVGLSALFVLLCTYLAWIPFIPANDYYNPGRFGLGNRVNLLAQLFFLTGVVLVLMTLVKVAGRKVVFVAAGLIIAAGLFGGLFTVYFSQTRQAQQDYLSAKVKRQQILSEVKLLLPRVNAGEEILLGDYHLTASLQWVPVFSATWDTTGAVDLLYDSGSILAQPVSPALGCARHELTQPSIEKITRMPYRRIVIVDLKRHRLDRISDQAECRVELVKLATNPDPL
jgi:hypothetical protein